MSMEARAAFDRLLGEGQPVASAPAVPRENDEAAVTRANREALKAWGFGGPVIQ